MFDDELEGASGDRHALADLAAGVEQDSRMAGCRKLVVAAAWADAHSQVDHPDGGPLVERLVSIGPTGCPPVAEFAPQGLVGPFDTSTQSARGWITDALTIRHRLPRLWERVAAGQVHHWKARQIATLTAHLSVVVAAQVDQQTTPWVGQLSWASFLRSLDATMLEADETTYRERARLAAARREVRATQSEDGLRTLIARGEAGDVTMMLALYQRVADCLADEGDEDPLPIRMSKAIGIIANPARLQDLLLRHAGDPDPHRQPWEQVAAHHADPSDPWADDLPPAGWQTAEHGNYHQPTPDDDDWDDGWDDWWDLPRPDEDEHTDTPADPPIHPDDLAWYHQQTNDEHDPAEDGAADPGLVASDPDPEQARWPAAFRRPRWQPLTPAQAAACAPTVVMHVHLSDQTLRDNHGVVRTDTGPILLEQLHRYLVQHDANIKIYPGDGPGRDRQRGLLRDPAQAAPGHGHPPPPLGVPQLPQPQPARPGPHPRLPKRRAARADRDAHPRTPRPIRAPRQDHRPLAIQTTRARHLPVAITRRLDRDHHQPRHPHARTHHLGHPPLGHRRLGPARPIPATGTWPPTGQIRDHRLPAPATKTAVPVPKGGNWNPQDIAIGAVKSVPIEGLITRSVSGDEEAGDEWRANWWCGR